MDCIIFHWKNSRYSCNAARTISAPFIDPLPFSHVHEIATPLPNTSRPISCLFRNPFFLISPSLSFLLYLHMSPITPYTTRDRKAKTSSIHGPLSSFEPSSCPPSIVVRPQCQHTITPALGHSPHSKQHRCARMCSPKASRSGYLRRVSVSLLRAEVDPHTHSRHVSKVNEVPSKGDEGSFWLLQ